MGEVVFGGNVVMKGYLKDEEATAAAFRLGALASGDLAVKDEDGYVAIRDRSKDRDYFGRRERVLTKRRGGAHGARRRRAVCRRRAARREVGRDALRLRRDRS